MRRFGGPTYTMALLEVSGEAFEEIRRKLEAAGYQHAFGESDGLPTIDMHGIGLKPPPAPPTVPYPPIADAPSEHLPGEVTTLEFGPSGTTMALGEQTVEPRGTATREEIEVLEREIARRLEEHELTHAQASDLLHEAWAKEEHWRDRAARQAAPIIDELLHQYPVAGEDRPTIQRGKLTPSLLGLELEQRTEFDWVVTFNWATHNFDCAPRLRATYCARWSFQP